MKLMIEIPEKVLKTRRYTDFFGCGSTMLTAMLDSGTPLDTVLDKIRTEIEQEYNLLSATRADETLELGECLGLKMALKIINKYKAERGGKE